MGHQFRSNDIGDTEKRLFNFIINEQKKHLLINDSGEMNPIKYYLFMEKNSPFIVALHRHSSRLSLGV